MNKEAIFSDGTDNYRVPSEPNVNGIVNIKIRTSLEDDLQVYLWSLGTKMRMSYSGAKGAFRYYSADIRLGADSFFYCFEIADTNEVVFYDRRGISEYKRSDSLFCIQPGFSTPQWAKGAVMYQILVDRFANGDTRNDVCDNEYYYISTYSKHLEDWNAPPKEFDVANFYGGDLEGVRTKLSYLKSLGVDAIYLNPIFVSPSNHKYDTQDYDHIDPHYGRIVVDEGEALSDQNTYNGNASKYKSRVTNSINLEESDKLFIELVKEAHSRGIKVILDGVFNHCGSFNKWLDKEEIYGGADGNIKGAYWDEQSPYIEYFGFAQNNWPRNDSYEGWWNHDTLPKLNYDNSKKLQEEILRIAKKWVSPPFNADGWRLDVAADLGHSLECNHAFWKDFRKAVKEANPNAIILAEHYGDASGWLCGDEWDTVMNYDAFFDPVSYFFTGMEKHSDSFEPNLLGNGEWFRDCMTDNMIKLMTPSIHCSMNQLSNHDHSRFLTRTNHLVGRLGSCESDMAKEGVDIATLMLATLLQMTWPGAPTLYYADEVGQVGFTDPDSRRTFPWGKETGEITDFFRDAVFLHKSKEVIKTGSFTFLVCDKNFISYARFSEDEHIVVVFNTSEECVKKRIPVWIANVGTVDSLERIFMVNESGYSILPESVDVENGYLNYEFAPKSGEVFWSEKGEK